MKNLLQTRFVPALAGFLLLLLLGAAQNQSSDETAALRVKVDALEKQVASLCRTAFVPELGDLMGGMQMRHAKLWFAGANENWPLAAYEIHEMHETFEAVEKFHPTHGKNAQPLQPLMAGFIEPPLQQLAKMVEAKDKENFVKAFDAVTLGCNACHQAAGAPFNVVKRPTAPPYSNQEFALRQ